jgi:hypothetical protein
VDYFMLIYGLFTPMQRREYCQCEVFWKWFSWKHLHLHYTIPPVWLKSYLRLKIIPQTQIESGATLQNYKATWTSLLTNEKAKSSFTRRLLRPSHPLMWALYFRMQSKVWKVNGLCGVLVLTTLAEVQHILDKSFLFILVSIFKAIRIWIIYFPHNSSHKGHIRYIKHVVGQCFFAVKCRWYVIKSP